MHSVLIPTAVDYPVVLRALFLLFLVIPSYPFPSTAAFALSHSEKKNKESKINRLHYSGRYVFKTTRVKIFNC